MIAVRALFVLLTAVVVVSASPSVTRADHRRDAEMEARARYAAALRAMELGAYGEARTALEASYALAPYPGTLLLLGQCEEALGRIDAAIARYEQFLGVAQSSSRRAEIAVKVSKLRDGLAASRAERAAVEAEREALLPMAVPPTVASASSSSSSSLEGLRAITVAPKRPSSPPRSRRWVWGVVAGAAVVVVGGAIGLGVGLGTARPAPPTRIMDVAF